MPEIKISPDLMDTIIDSEWIKQVYFTAKNQHFFNKHDLDGKSYGYLKLEPVLSHTIGDRRFYKNKLVANPEVEIVATLTREQIMAMDVTEESEIFPKNRRSAAKKKAKVA